MAGDDDVRLLVVFHSRGGATRALCDAAIAGARDADAEPRVRDAFVAGPDDVRWAQAVLLATPARFGYMSGALKDFFERIWHPCLDVTVGLPYALVIKGDTDVDGGVSSIERITTGLKWRRVLPPLTVVGAVDDAHRDAARELGATLAAGVAEGVF